MTRWRSRSEGGTRLRWISSLEMNAKMNTLVRQNGHTITRVFLCTEVENVQGLR